MCDWVQCIYLFWDEHSHTNRASFYRNFEPNKCRCCKSFITFYHLILAHKCFGVEYFSNAIITLDFFLLFLHSISIRMAERHQMCTLFGVSRFMHFGKWNQCYLLVHDNRLRLQTLCLTRENPNRYRRLLA